MKFELRPARPADVEAIMQVMADAMANLQHPEWFVPDDAVYMAEHISGPKGFCLVARKKRPAHWQRILPSSWPVLPPMLWAGSWA